MGIKQEMQNAAAKTAKIAEQTFKPKGYCPKCGSPLTFKNVVYCWDVNGYPTHVETNDYCPQCNHLIEYEPADPKYFLENWDTEKRKLGKIQ